MAQAGVARSFYGFAIGQASAISNVSRRRRLACASDPKQATIGYQLSVREVVHPAWLPPAATTLAMADNPGGPRKNPAHTQTAPEALNFPLRPRDRTLCRRITPNAPRRA